MIWSPLQTHSGKITFTQENTVLADEAGCACRYVLFWFIARAPTPAGRHALMLEAPRGGRDAHQVSSALPISADDPSAYHTGNPAVRWHSAQSRRTDLPSWIGTSTNEVEPQQSQASVWVSALARFSTSKVSCRESAAGGTECWISTGFGAGGSVGKRRLASQAGPHADDQVR